MKRFRFALQRVRRLRQHQERAARLAMARELATLGALDERRKQVEANLLNCGWQGDGDRMAQLARALELGLTSARRRICLEIEKAEKDVEAAREVYRTRRRDLLSLDRIRDRRWVVWNEERQAEEQREFDEMARLRFAAEGGKSPR